MSDINVLEAAFEAEIEGEMVRRFFGYYYRNYVTKGLLVDEPSAHNVARRLCGKVSEIIKNAAFAQRLQKG